MSPSGCTGLRVRSPLLASLTCKVSSEPPPTVAVALIFLSTLARECVAPGPPLASGGWAQARLLRVLLGWRWEADPCPHSGLQAVRRSKGRLPPPRALRPLPRPSLGGQYISSLGLNSWNLGFYH